MAKPEKKPGARGRKAPKPASPSSTPPPSASAAVVGFEATLWLAADKLRNNMDAAEYKHVVLELIFLKYISDAFDAIDQYLYQLLLTPEYRTYYANRATGSAVVALSRDDFLSYPFARPPESLLQRFNALVRPLQSRSEHCAAESDRLAETRDALLPRLLSGELSVAKSDRQLEMTL